MPEEAPGKSFENPRGPPRRPQARLTPFLQGAVTPSMKATKNPPTKFLSWTPFGKKPFRKSRSIDGSNPLILRVFSDCVERIPRKSQVAMTPGEIGERSPRPLATDFARRGPWGGLLCAVWKLNKTIQGVTGDLTRPWAVGPANFEMFRRRARGYAGG